MMTLVVPKTGFYIVGTLGAEGLETEQVDKSKQCTCGGSSDEPCPHIQAVATYLRLGGERAPAPEPEEPEGSIELPDVCPICGSPVTAEMGHWRCSRSPGHYWRHRGEQSGVKAFLCGSHPAKQGPFYEQTSEERDAFLAQAHRRLYADGRSPYL